MGAPATSEPGTSTDPAPTAATEPASAVVTLASLDAKLDALITSQESWLSSFHQRLDRMGTVVSTALTSAKADVAAAPSKVKAFASKVESGASAVFADVKSNWLLVLVALGVIAVAVEINVELIKGLVSKL